MTKTLLLIALAITVSKSFSKDILLECGTSTRNGFNGWMISPFDVFDQVLFTDETIDFYANNQGGDYTISLTRKIESMKDYSQLELSVEINAIHNCFVNSINVFVSEDGRSWTTIQLDQTNYLATIQNENLSLQFLKIAVNVSFEPSGYLQCSYVKLEGENDWEMELIEPEPQVITNPFFFFFFNKTKKCNFKLNKFIESSLNSSSVKKFKKKSTEIISSKNKFINSIKLSGLIPI